MRTFVGILIALGVIALGILAFGRWMGPVEFVALLLLALAVGAWFIARMPVTRSGWIALVVVAVAVGLWTVSPWGGPLGDESGSQSGTHGTP